MKKKGFLMLSCIAAVAIATFVGKKTFESHAYETSSLMMQNVAALSSNDNASQRYHLCYYESKVSKGRTYYDCGPCEKVYDEKGVGTVSKCFY